jgi:hypothetical protein
MGTQLTARQEALYAYIRHYMIKWNGRPPTLNEMIAANIGKETLARAITSKSVLRYNLLKLEKNGLINIIKDGTSRNISLPNGVYIIHDPDANEPGDEHATP